MRYLLDSDVISDLHDPTSAGHSKIAATLSALADEDEVCISVLALYELEYSHANAEDDLKEMIAQVITQVQTEFIALPLSKEGAYFFGSFKKTIRDSRRLSKHRARMHNIDMMMAATAMVENCILVSADSVYQELSRHHSDLQVEDWTIDKPRPEKSAASAPETD